MSILKNRAQAQAAETKSTPAFEAGEDTGASQSENPADGVQDTGAQSQAEAAATVAAAADKATGNKSTKTTAAKNTDEPADKAESKDEPVKSTSQVVPVAGGSLIPRDENGKIKTFLSGGASANPLMELKYAFQKADMGGIDYSTFPRVRLESGKLASTDGKLAGEFIELQVVSWQPSWTVTIGSDDDKGKELVRFSDDGKVIRGIGDDDDWDGKELTEYRDYLINEGHEKAAIREYVNVYGICLDAEETDFPQGEVYMLALAPMSKINWDRYLVARPFQVRMGKVKEDHGNPVLRFTVERQKNTKRTFFVLKIEQGLAAAIEV